MIQIFKIRVPCFFMIHVYNRFTDQQHLFFNIVIHLFQKKKRRRAEYYFYNITHIFVSNQIKNEDTTQRFCVQGEIN